jgi:hypothetical protein
MSDRKAVVVSLVWGKKRSYLKRSDNYSAFGNYAMPLVRRMFPELLATKVVGVQPMTAPMGLAYNEPDRRKKGFEVRCVSEFE